MRHKMDIIEAFATKNKCYKAYDNAVYHYIKPGNTAWHTFYRTLHDTTAYSPDEYAAAIINYHTNAAVSATDIGVNMTAHLVFNGSSGILMNPAS